MHFNYMSLKKLQKHVLHDTQYKHTEMYQEPYPTDIISFIPFTAMNERWDDFVFYTF